MKLATTICGALALGLTVAGCDEEGDGGGGGRFGTGSGAAAAASGESSGEADKARAAVVYRDEDFVESESNRDPFRSYVTTFQAKASDSVQRRVVMATTAIEEMKLIAIIGGTPRPKAMIVDPLGVGHIVERGVYIGRPKIIQATGSVAMTLNWRVDRIRENEVVLTREDPTDPGRPSLTRIIPLRDDAATL